VLEAKRFQVVHFDHPHTALLFKLVRKLQPQARTILDAHNVEADIVERLADAGPRWKRPLLRWQASRVRRLEKRLARAMDLVLTCSEKDGEEFRGLGAKKVRVVPNGIPPLLTAPAADRTDVVFVGSLDWHPNVDAALTLARDIWPLVRGTLPGARLVLVGRNPPHAIRELAGPDVVVTGAVESVAPFLRRARATAIPLRIGSGTRIKILEAWAAGIPVIASRIAAEGLPYTDGKDVLLAEDPMQFARALQRVWKDPALAQRMMSEGRRTVEPFSPSRVAQRLIESYCEELAAASGSRGSDDRYKRAYSDAIAATS